jgi:hypothetical protein
MFSKIAVLYEIYSKKLVTEYFWHVSVPVEIINIQDDTYKIYSFNSVFVGKKNHQNRTRVDFEIMFLTNVVLHEIYSKKSQ